MKYKLSKDFAGYKAGDELQQYSGDNELYSSEIRVETIRFLNPVDGFVIDELQQYSGDNERYNCYKNSTPYSIHIDIITALPDIFQPVKEKIKVYVGIGYLVAGSGGYVTSLAYLDKSYIRNPVFKQIIEVEIDEP